MQLNSKVIKKWQPPTPPPSFLHKHPLFRIIPLSSKIFGTPPSQVTQFLEGPKLGGDSNYAYIVIMESQSYRMIITTKYGDETYTTLEEYQSALGS